MSARTDLPKNNIGRLLFRYALPSTLSVWIFALYTMVDGMFVGKVVGAQALAAVNLSLPYISILFAISILVTIGAATLVGVQRGAGNPQQASRIFSTAIYTLLLFGLTVCGLSYFFIEDIAVLLGARGELVPLVVEYLQTLLVFNTFYLVAYSMEVFVKVDGFPKRELIVICIAALTNIALDYLLIVEQGMGLKGAAIATGCAQLLQGILLLLHFRSKVGTLRFVRVLPSPGLVLKFFKIGIPDSITEMSSGFVLLAFNHVILSSLSTSELSAFSVIGYISNFMLLTMIGLSQGMQPLVTYFRGQNHHEKTKQLLILTLKSAFTATALSFLTLYAFGDWLAAMFLNDKILINRSHDIMKVFCLGFLFLGMNVVLSAYFTAMEKMISAGILSLLRSTVLVIILLMTLPSLMGPNSIWLVAPISEALTLLVGIYLIRRPQSGWRPRGLATS
ncbi:MAG: MATE family efflux transporter [Endozoicomonas sp.]|uniref:MATE family efflux transporter n=1 Tax=Endozoicomonas sp. TaxID=1892382 RepID=UPI003D9AF552